MIKYIAGAQCRGAHCAPADKKTHAGKKTPAEKNTRLRKNENAPVTECISAICERV
jgi:hypothetical protein